jgi:serum/glucocorticoid-regulated kinase 2
MPKSSRGALAGRTMPSILNRSVSQATSIQHPEFQSKNKFKTALGLPHNNNVSTASTLPHKRHSRSPSDIISQAFFVPVDSQEMKLAVPPQAQPSLATAVQRDLWNISVAESPHDSLNYSIYIKTPTHSLTLTRSAKEIVDLHAKLHETWPSQTLPSLPIDSDLLRSRPQKRRSSFLTTLSRLTSSPRSVKAHNVHSPTRSPSRTPAAEYQDPFGDDLDPAVVLNPTATATALASYLTTISNHSAFRTSRPWKRFVRVRTDDLESTRVERAIKRVKSDSGMRDGIGHDQPKTSAITPMDVLPRGSEADAKDPKEPDTPAPQPNGTVTPVDPDEEPLCDRGILDAIRTGPSTADLRLTTSIPEQPEETPTAAPAAESTASLSVSPTNTATSTAVRTETDRERETDQEHDGMTSSAGTTTASTMTTTSGGTTEPTSPDDAPSSPSASRKGEVEEEARPHPYTRIPRSASADPDKSMRRSRLWDSGPDGEMTETDADESGVEGPEKKIKKSRRPSGRKVVVDDFEMMRVLGKGCAGKVNPLEI